MQRGWFYQRLVEFGIIEFSNRIKWKRLDDHFAQIVTVSVHKCSVIKQSDVISFDSLETVLMVYLSKVDIFAPNKITTEAERPLQERKSPINTMHSLCVNVWEWQLCVSYT